MMCLRTVHSFLLRPCGAISPYSIACVYIHQVETKVNDLKADLFEVVFNLQRDRNVMREKLKVCSLSLISLGINGSHSGR